ncbi:1916_t:CDS:2, partial [Racocetra fulgida]
AIATLIQTQQELTDALNLRGNTNANADIAQLVPNTNNNTPKISIRILNYKGESQENVVAWLLQTIPGALQVVNIIEKKRRIVLSVECQDIIQKTDEPNQPLHIITNNSLELTQVEKNCEWLLKFNGKINDHPAWILLDSGASRNFIDKDFATQNKLTLNTETMVISCQPQHQLEKKYLGFPKVIEVQADSQKTPKNPSCNSVFISQQQLAKVPDSEEIFTLHISQESNKDTNTQQPEVQKILQNFND